MLFSSMKKGTDLVFIIEENFPHLPVYQKNQNEFSNIIYTYIPYK